MLIYFFLARVPEMSVFASMQGGERRNLPYTERSGGIGGWWGRHVGVALMAGALASSAASAQVVSFDDPPLVHATILPSSYGRANTVWTNVYGINQSSGSLVCRSGPSCVYNFGGNTISVASSSPFTFSGYIRQWNLQASPAASVLVEGTFGGSVVSSQVLALTSAYQFFAITQTVDFVRFTPSGFTSNSCGSAVPITACYYVIDDVTFGSPASPTPVPEPSTAGLLIAAFGALAGFGRHRRA